MKYVYISDGKVADTSQVDPFTIFQEAYAIQFIETHDEVEGGWLYDGETFTAPPESVGAIPQEVTMGQCRLALYDLHGIEDDAEFYGLTDMLPEDQRPRARLELRTRTSVRYDNELVIAVCQAKGWNREELFTYAAVL